MARAPTPADVFHAIADARRRQIVDLLAQRGTMAVYALVAAMGIAQPAVSKHLGVLRKVGVVSVVRQGQLRVYSLQAQRLKAVHDWVSAYERLWSRQLDRIKLRAEAQARARAQAGPAPSAAVSSGPITSRTITSRK